MLIEEHIAAAAYEYLNDWAPRDDDGLISTNLPTDIDGNPEGLDQPRRRALYWQLVDRGWQYQRLTPSLPGSLPRKLSRWTDDPDAVSNLLTNWAHRYPKIPPHITLSFIFSAHNASPPRDAARAPRSPFCPAALTAPTPASFAASLAPASSSILSSTSLAPAP